MSHLFLPLLCACVIGSVTAWAQPYPSRPIKVIVPMQAGTAGDSIMRIVAEQISANIGHPLIVENITGAAGLIGAERLAHAPADGYTIGAMSDSMLAVVPHLQPRINYDPLDGFEPVSMVASITSVLVVNPQLAVANTREFVALAKTRPGMVDYASGGIGSQQHVAMAALSDATGISLNHVPFRGASQAAMEVVSGRMPVMFVALSIALPLIKDGRLRAIAVASKGRIGIVARRAHGVRIGIAWFCIYTVGGYLCAKGTPNANHRSASIVKPWRP